MNLTQQYEISVDRITEEISFVCMGCGYDAEHGRSESVDTLEEAVRWAIEHDAYWHSNNDGTVSPLPSYFETFSAADVR